MATKNNTTKFCCVFHQKTQWDCVFVVLFSIANFVVHFDETHNEIVISLCMCFIFVITFREKLFFLFYCLS